MRGNPGKVVKFIHNGKIQKAVAHNKMQYIEFTKLGKVHISWINDDFTPVMEEGKQKTSLIGAEFLIVIGMYD